MHRIAIFSIALLFSLSGFVASAANADNPGVRHARQRARVHAGVEQGALAPGEARRLRHQHGEILKSKQRMLADDGKIGPAERKRLHRMQDRFSRQIFRAKHNERVR